MGPSGRLKKPSMVPPCELSPLAKVVPVMSMPPSTLLGSGFLVMMRSVPESELAP